MIGNKVLQAVAHRSGSRLAAMGLVLAAGALAACASSGEREGEADAFKGELDSGALNTEEVSRPEFLMASGLNCDAALLTQFDVAAAATAPVLLDDLQAGTLGEDGANTLAAEALGNVGGLCDVGLLPETQAVVEEAVALGEGGQQDEALALLNEHLQELQAGAAAGGGHLAAPAGYETADRQRVKAMLVQQALAQTYGGTEAGEPYGEAAKRVLRDAAAGDLPTAGWEEALIIQKDALIVGDDDLAEEAAIRVGEAVDEDLAAELAALNPCTATQEQVNILGYRVANALGMGRNQELAEEGQSAWIEAQVILSKRSRSEDVPECGEPLAFEWTHTHGRGMVTSGSAYTCDGEMWHIDFESVWVAPEYTSETSGALDFAVAGGTTDSVVDGETKTLKLPTEGTIVVVAGGGGELTVEDPLDFRLTIDEENKTGSLYLESTGEGIMYAPATADDPDSMGTVGPGEEIPVTLVPYEGEGCGSQ